MTVPPRPMQIPRPNFDDKLSACIAAGDCQQVRDLFDRAFWDDYKIFLTWEHLKTALKAENKPMLKLLVTWGARPNDEGLAWLWFREYRHFIKLLRQCGLPLSDAAIAEAWQKKQTEKKAENRKVGEILCDGSNYWFAPAKKPETPKTGDAAPAPRPRSGTSDTGPR
jgi:hypothetical protein